MFDKTWHDYLELAEMWLDRNYFPNMTDVEVAKMLWERDKMASEKSDGNRPTSHR